MKRAFLYFLAISVAASLALAGLSKSESAVRSRVRKPSSSRGGKKASIRSVGSAARPAKIALIKSSVSAEYGKNALQRQVDFSYYAEEILHNYGITFDVIDDGRLNERALSPYALVIAAGWSRAGSADAVKAVEKFVNSGGIFLSTGWLLAENFGGAGALDRFIGVRASAARRAEYRLSFDAGDDPIFRKWGASTIYGVTRGRGALGFDRVIDAVSGARAIGKMYDESGNRVGDAVVVAERGRGYAVSAGLDFANAIAAYREPVDPSLVADFQGPHADPSAKRAAERGFRNLIEYALSLKGLPLVYKWNSENGARITAFDRDDIDRPFDFDQIETRVNLRQRHGAQGTTYIRVTEGSGLPPLIRKDKVADWESRGSQIALHSEFASRGGGNGSAVSEARWEKKRAEELFGHPVVDEVAHGAPGNSDAGSWEPSTEAGFAAAGHAATSYVERLPLASLGYSVFGIPAQVVFESVPLEEDKRVFDEELKSHGFFGFLAHSEYLPESEYSHRKIALKRGILASLDEFYSYMVSKGAVIRSAEQIRKYEENRRLARISYERYEDGSLRISIFDPSGGVWAAVPGRWSGADAVYDGYESVSLFRRSAVTRRIGD